ncbi:MAG: VOC family protein, partial [Sciscionella sp.]
MTSDVAAVLREHLTAIDHVGVAVADLDEAITFYRETFGMLAVHVEVNEEQGVREAMVRASSDDGTGTAVQLLAPLRADSTIGKFLTSKGPGLQQLAYRVSDIDTVTAALKEKGVRLLYPEAQRGTADSRVN